MRPHSGAQRLVGSASLPPERPRLDTTGVPDLRSRLPHPYRPRPHTHLMTSEGQKRAAARGEAARRRAKELDRLSVRLAAGRPLTKNDAVEAVQDAQARSDDAAESAKART